jgi:L-lactate dehydrogenase complex protein LldG
LSSPRESFLSCVREAVAAGARAGAPKSIESRGNIGYQGAGTDSVERFVAELTTLGGHAWVVRTPTEVISTIVDILRPFSPKKVLLGQGGILDSLDLENELAVLGCRFQNVGKLHDDDWKEKMFPAEAGISRVDYLIAESGTMVIKSAPDHPRALSLLPPVYIAVAERSQLLPDLFDVFAAEEPQAGRPPPSCLTFITGPSKTGDIELRLVTGVHGPGEVHVVLLNNSED